MDGAGHATNVAARDTPHDLEAITDVGIGLVLEAVEVAVAVLPLCVGRFVDARQARARVDPIETRVVVPIIGVVGTHAARLELAVVGDDEHAA